MFREARGPEAKTSYSGDGASAGVRGLLGPPSDTYPHHQVPALRLLPLGCPCLSSQPQLVTGRPPHSAPSQVSWGSAY